MVALLYSPNGIKISGFDRLIINGIIEYNEDGSYTDEIYRIYGMENKNGK